MVFESLWQYRQKEVHLDSIFLKWFKKQIAIAQREVNPDSMSDGVQETGRCDGGLVVEGYKHIIFLPLAIVNKHTIFYY
jgi:hypothetical protein